MSDGKHECPWPYCHRRVGRELWECPTHWFKLPEQLRTKLSRAWRRGTFAEYVEVLEEIDNWIEANVLVED